MRALSVHYIRKLKTKLYKKKAEPKIVPPFFNVFRLFYWKNLLNSSNEIVLFSKVTFSLTTAINLALAA